MLNVLSTLTLSNSGIVTDIVMLVCQLLRRDLRELQELVDTMEPVESWDEGQPSHVIATQYVSTRVRENVRYTDISTYRRTKPFSMELGIVLKGPLSLPRQFLLCSKSQNIKELICWANTPLVRNVIVLYYLYLKRIESYNYILTINS